MEQPWGRLSLLLSQKFVMQHVEESALATCRQTIPLWLPYVDDAVTAVHQNEIDDFHDHLNEQNADIQFTKEIEESRKLPLLDCLVCCDNNELRTTVYRKPTPTDRLLDESSYNPTSHKATAIKTLTRRAQLVCDTSDSLRDENSHLERVFHKNNYNADFIRRNIYRPSEADATNRNPTSATTVTITFPNALTFKNAQNHMINIHFSANWMVDLCHAPH